MITNETTDKRVNLQNVLTAHAAQYEKNQEPNQKVGKTHKHIFPKKVYQWILNTWKDAQHHSLLDKNKSKL